MFKSSKSKKGLKNIVSFLLVAAILITGALAYLTATDSKENKFTVGNVSIELTEPNWNEENGKNIVPGETIAKDPQIENTGLNDAYVYIMVTVPKKDQITVNEDGEKVVKDNFQLFTYDVNENWTLIKSKSDDANENNYYVYAYNTTLTPNVTTEPLFTEVTFANIVSDQISSTEELEILVNGYAIQSDSVFNAEGNPASSEEAWEIYATQNGWDFPVETPAGYSSLNFINENGVVVHTEVAEAGTPVDMYFEDSLAKDGFTFDWVDSTTNEVAYSGMPMPEKNTTLNATYTETGYGEPTKNLAYGLAYDETNGLYARLVKDTSSWAAGANYEQYNNSTVVVPSYITVEYQSASKAVGVDAYISSVASASVTPLKNSGATVGETIKVPVKAIMDLTVLNPKTVVLPDTVTMYHDTMCSDGVGSASGGISADNLTEITLPYGVENVPEQCFAYCAGLTTVNLPSSVKSVEYMAFYNCGKLENIILPKSLTNIGQYAFDGLAIKNIVIPENVTFEDSFEGGIFSDCSSLETVVFEDGVNMIPKQSFYNCPSLKSITIPKSVTTIGQFANSAVQEHRDIYYSGTEEEWNNIDGSDKVSSYNNYTIHFES